MRYPEVIPPIPEEDDEEEEGDWIEDARLSVVEFLLKRYGNLAPSDIAKILGWKVREVKEILVRLEHFGKAERVKVGRRQIWVYRDKLAPLMYY